MATISSGKKNLTLHLNVNRYIYWDKIKFDDWKCFEKQYFHLDFKVITWLGVT